jgi:hypothetical protein
MSKTTQNKLAVLTCTSGRPKAFAQLAKLVKNQTVEDFDWIIVCDDDSDYVFPRKCKVVHREVGGLPSLNANLIEGLKLDYDRWIVMEDDDFYTSSYVAETNKLLDNHDLVGWQEDAYYYILSRRACRRHNIGFSALACTGFTKAVVPFVTAVASLGRSNIDTMLWCNYQTADCAKDATLAALGAIQPASKALFNNFNGVQWGKPIPVSADDPSNTRWAKLQPRHIGCKENWHGGKNQISPCEPTGAFDVNGRTARTWFGDADSRFYLAFTTVKIQEGTLHEMETV